MSQLFSGKDTLGHEGGWWGGVGWMVGLGVAELGMAGGRGWRVG